MPAPQIPLVSVVVTTRNEATNIATCLESIRSQTHPAIEIIVVDNNSTDATADMARYYTDKVFNKGPERSAQRNFGIMEAAGGEYAMFVDADMILAPGLVAQCVRQIEARSALALHIPEIVLGRRFLSRCRRFERRFYDGTVIDGARFFRRETFARVGGFDLTMSGPEDWDLDKKIKQLGTIALLSEDVQGARPPFPLAAFVRERGVDPDRHGQVIFHNESEFRLGSYLRKKHYYAQSYDGYMDKWGRHDPDIRKQYGAWYRFAGVFLEDGKWRRLLSRPHLALGMYLLRFLVGLSFVLRRRA